MHNTSGSDPPDVDRGGPEVATPGPRSLPVRGGPTLTPQQDYLAVAFTTGMPDCQYAVQGSSRPQYWVAEIRRKPFGAAFAGLQERAMLLISAFDAGTSAGPAVRGCFQHNEFAPPTVVGRHLVYEDVDLAYLLSCVSAEFAVDTYQASLTGLVPWWCKETDLYLSCTVGEPLYCGAMAVMSMGGLGAEFLRNDAAYRVVLAHIGSVMEYGPSIDPGPGPISFGVEEDPVDVVGDGHPPSAEDVAADVTGELPPGDLPEELEEVPEGIESSPPEMDWRADPEVVVDTVRLMPPKRSVTCDPDVRPLTLARGGDSSEKFMELFSPHVVRGGTLLVVGDDPGIAHRRVRTAGMLVYGMDQSYPQGTSDIDDGYKREWLSVRPIVLVADGDDAPTARAIAGVPPDLVEDAVLDMSWRATLQARVRGLRPSIMFYDIGTAPAARRFDTTMNVSAFAMALPHALATTVHIIKTRSVPVGIPDGQYYWRNGDSINPNSTEVYLTTARREDAHAAITVSGGKFSVVGTGREAGAWSAALEMCGLVTGRSYPLAWDSEEVWYALARAKPFISYRCGLTSATMTHPHALSWRAGAERYALDGFGGARLQDELRRELHRWSHRGMRYSLVSRYATSHGALSNIRRVLGMFRPLVKHGTRAIGEAERQTLGRVEAFPLYCECRGVERVAAEDGFRVVSPLPDAEDIAPQAALTALADSFVAEGLLWWARTLCATQASPPHMYEVVRHALRISSQRTRRLQVAMVATLLDEALSSTRVARRYEIPAERRARLIKVAREQLDAARCSALKDDAVWAPYIQGLKDWIAQCDAGGGGSSGGKRRGGGAAILPLPTVPAPVGVGRVPFAPQRALVPGTPVPAKPPDTAKAVPDAPQSSGAVDVGYTRPAPSTRRARQSNRSAAVVTKKKVPATKDPPAPDAG